jgi:hypothetical protein
MKRNILLLIIVALFSLNQVDAQAPEKINYQGVARSSTGLPIKDQAIKLRLSIIDVSITGSIVYSETHEVTTNAYGLYNVQIGTGVIISGTMNAIKWANGEKYLKVEIDPDGGTDFIELGTTQLISVPYALRAEDAGMITVFNKGTNNPNKMVVRHSLAYPYWGLQYNDPLDQFEFIYSNSDPSTLSVDLYDGRVGIKIPQGTRPTANLEVNGTVKITGGAPGDSKVLVSDATGLASWQDNSTKISAFQPVGCRNLINVTPVWQKIADMGTATKLYSDTWFDLTLQTTLYVDIFLTGCTGVEFELRVDDVKTTIGNATALVKEPKKFVPISINGVFNGLSASTHTVSLWARGSNGNATDAYYDPGCYNSAGINNVLIKEYR